MGDPVMGSRRKYRGLKIVLAIVTLLLVAAWGYVAWVNRNTENMTGRQKILKAVYPLFMWWSNKKGVGTKKLGSTDVAPPVSFYSLKDTLINGTPFDFASLKGRKVLLVNTASDCGYTGQYDDLQKLSERYKDKLVVIGFPANDFKEQEKGNNNDIAEFCRINFGVSFPLMQKSVVIRKEGQNPVLQWLTDPAKNGWSKQQPSWNFWKYLVDENGKLVNYFGSSVEPLGKEITDALNP